MPRPLRIEYAGACYHLMSRGDSAGGDFPGRLGSETVPGSAGKSVCEEWVASACLLPDEQSFSRRSGDAATQSGGRDAVAAGHLYARF